MCSLLVAVSMAINVKGFHGGLEREVQQEGKEGEADEGWPVMNWDVKGEICSMKMKERKENKITHIQVGSICQKE